MARSLQLLIAVVLLLGTLPNIGTEFNNDILEINDSSKQSTINEPNNLKIHMPGSNYSDEEKLVWSPNNISGFSTMQITFNLSGDENYLSINKIQIFGHWLSDTIRVQQFEILIDTFEIYETTHGMFLTHNYTYPNTIWGGSYILSVNTSYEGGSFSTHEKNGLEFLNYDYHLYVTNSQVKFCLCDDTEIELSLANTGEKDFDLMYNISLPNNQSSFSTVQWSNKLIREDYVSGELTTEEFVQNNISISTKSNERENDTLAVNIYVKIFYENDSGSYVYLFDDYYTITGILLPEKAPPSMEVSISNFEQKINYVGNWISKLPPNISTTIFLDDMQNIHLGIAIINFGYYDEFLTVNANNSNFNYSIGYDDKYISILQFNSLQAIVPSASQIEIELIISGSPTFDLEFANLSFYYSKQFMTHIPLEIAKEPIITNQVIYSNDNFTDLATPLNFSGTINIDLSSYENYIYFENRWLLSCSSQQQQLYG